MAPDTMRKKPKYEPISDYLLERFSERYNVEATRDKVLEGVVNLAGQRFSLELCHRGLTDRKAYEFIKITLIEKHADASVIKLLRSLKEAMDANEKK